MSRHAYWLATLLFAGLVLAKFDPHSGFASLLRFGERWQAQRLPAIRSFSLPTVANSAGYDGQFYAQLALDPLLRDPALATALDSPAYRARRILAPATAAAVGLGQPWWTLQAYALLNVACWFAFAWLLRRTIADAGWLGFARWAGCVFSMGVLDSVRQSLVDLPAMLLLLLAVRSHLQARPSRTGTWLSLAALTKETSLLGSLAVLFDPSAVRAQPLRRAALFAATALPLGLWSLYVASRFPPLAGSSGLGNFSLPLVGAFDQLTLSVHELARGNLDGRYSFAVLALIGLAVQAAVLWRRPQPDSPWWRIGAVYALLLLFLGAWVATMDFTDRTDIQPSR
ncbi:MAG: DUF2029 domain-containing protein [Opitutae bacterium]|nr:DUF2029 domain-containing protein [Opitutae bacterium]